MRSLITTAGKIAFSAFFLFHAIVLVADGIEPEAAETSLVVAQLAPVEGVPDRSSPEVLDAIVEATERLENEYAEGEIECLDLLAQIDAFIDQLSFDLVDLQDRPEWSDAVARLVEFRENLPCASTDEIIGTEQLVLGGETFPAPMALGSAPGAGFGGGGAGAAGGGAAGLLPLVGLGGLAGLIDSDDNPSTIIISQ